jgi:hypothetical protein
LKNALLARNDDELVLDPHPSEFAKEPETWHYRPESIVDYRYNKVYSLSLLIF